MFEYTCMKPEIRENFESEPLSSMNDHLDTRVDLNDLMRKVKDEEKRSKRQNIAISAAALSAVAVFGIILTL